MLNYNIEMPIFRIKVNHPLGLIQQFTMNRDFMTILWIKTAIWSFRIEVFIHIFHKNHGIISNKFDFIFHSACFVSLWIVLLKNSTFSYSQSFWKVIFSIFQDYNIHSGCFNFDFTGSDTIRWCYTKFISDHFSKWHFKKTIWFILYQFCLWALLQFPRWIYQKKICYRG